MGTQAKCFNCGGSWCGNHKKCHACEKDYGHYLIDAATGKITKTWQQIQDEATPAVVPGWSLTPRTQKGKGVIALKKHGIGSSHGVSVPGVYGFLTALDGMVKVGFPRDYFARPCPLTPRHGFVDSKVITTSDELKAMLTETLAADPNGEVMVMEPVPKPKWNVVWTPTSITAGKGNDGATNGSDTVSIPLMREHLPSKLLTAAEIPPNDDPYMEIVAGEWDTIYFTQLRSGPRMGAITANYIPSTVTVEKVLEAKGSLLEWERVIKAHSETLGIVVNHPGGSFTDHYTVHARTFGIPVVLDGRQLTPGDVLEKESEDVIPDPLAVLKGLVAGEKMDIPSGKTGSQIALMLTALYNASAMGGENGKWLGLAASMMLRFGSVALSGEARHVVGYFPHPHVKQKLERSEVYHRCYPFTLSRHRARCNRLTNILRYGFNGGSIGGEKWARCGASLMPLFNAVSELAREPGPEPVQKLIRALNVAVDQAHNGGWWMNKFTGEEMFTAIQTGSLHHILTGVPTMLAFNSIYQATTAPYIDKRQNEWASWPVTGFTPLRLDTAKVEHLPPIPAMVLRVKPRGLKGMEKTIEISTAALAKAIGGTFYVIPTPTGWGVELRHKNGVKKMIWTEQALLGE